MDENDFVVALYVSLNNADMVIKEEDPSDRSWKCVFWKNLSKVQRLVVVQYIENSCDLSNGDLYIIIRENIYLFLF